MNKKTRLSNANLLFEEMEPRLLLSADGLAVITEANIATSQQLVLGDNEINALIVQDHTEQLSPVIKAKQHSTELVIIDSRVPNFQQLHNDIIRAQQQGRDINVLILDAHRDGLEQISEALSKYNQLDAVHIVSHGKNSQLQLGATQLNKQNLLQRSDEIKQWQQVFSDGGDLLLYGCNLAQNEQGKQFVDELSQLTGADIAASDDTTGHALLGGDWSFEYTTGDIETQLAFSENMQQQWQGSLLTATNLDAAEFYIEDTALNLSDIDVTGSAFGDVTVTLTLSDDSAGSLNTATSGSVTSTFSTGVWTASGAEDDVNILLADITFTPSLNYNSDFTIDTSVDDGVTSEKKGKKDFTGFAVNDSPVATNDPGEYNTNLTALNPVTYWRMGETSGTSATDEVASGIDGTYSGVTLGQPGAIDGDANTAASFDGIDDYLVINHDDSFLLDDGTVQFWFNADNSSSNQGLFTKDANGVDTGGHFTIELSNTGSIEVKLEGTSGVKLMTSGSGSVTSGSWQHIAVTFGANGMELFLNGVSVDSNTYTGGLGTTSGDIGNYEPIIIGASTRTSITGTIAPLIDFFAGSIDEVAIIGQALTAEQIQNLFSSAVQNYTIAEDASLTVLASEGVLINDFDEEESPLTAILVSGPSNAASFMLNADGSFSYTPVANFSGTDTFTYVANDGNSDSSVAVVTITVIGENDAPTSTPVTLAAIAEDSGVRIITQAELLANASDLDGDVLSATGLSIVSGFGVLVDNGDATWNYSPALNDNTSVSFSYTITDGAVPVAASASLDITPVNDAPTALADNPAIVNEGGTAIFDLAVNDFDIDNTLNLNSIVITIAPANGSVIVNGDGTVSYTHDGSENLSDSFSYTILDVTGAISNIASVAVIVNPVNDAPLAAGDNPAAVDQGGTAIFDLSANDSDSDNALDLNSIDITSDPVNGSLIVNGDGTVSYIHDGSQTSTDNFSYTISDVSGAMSNVAIVNITVNLINNAPTSTGIVDVTVTEDSTATSIDLNTAFDDVDNLDSELTYSITGNTSIGLFKSTAVNAVTGELVLDYAADMNGSSQISIRATDPSGAFVDTLFTVTVTPVNDTPLLQANTGMAVLETNTTVISNTELNVNDIDNINTEIVYTVTTLPTNGVLLVNGVAATVFTEDDIVNNRLSYQSDGSVANDQFTFMVSDGAGSTISGNTFNIVVQLVPVEPEVNTINVDPGPLPDTVVTTTTVDTGENIQSEASIEVASEREDWYVGNNRTQPPPPQQVELTLEPVPQQPVQNDIGSYEEPVETSEAAKNNLSTVTSVADLQMKSVKALWQAIDQMKQQIDRNVTEDMTKVEFRAAAVSSSGMALSAGVVAWVLRGGALMSSLMSTIPLWKAYDPLPVLAYRDDDEDEEKNKNITADKIPASLEEMRKIKALKEKMNKHHQVDEMFSGPGATE